ncbi:hypothetical protein B9Z55_027775 [Caenorhabditis nigoni]|uniref:Uncharacterized protein n=1 Tax=Caenorhabditis nigoni TaxID=1611254 RepID=A0A2G5SEA2_9PELO|nr:hypothetical protein B9Z55_027775 [Caenorhabditis nigoni]
MSNSDAVKKLKMPRIVVRRTVLRYQRLRLQDEFPKAGHQFTLTPPAVVKAVREIIRQKPEKSTRKMVNDVCIFHRLVETIASEKLYLYYYQMQKTAFLTEKYQLFRKKKAKHLIGGTQAIFKPFLHFLMMKYWLLRLTKMPEGLYGKLPKFRFIDGCPREIMGRSSAKTPACRDRLFFGRNRAVIRADSGKFENYI